MSVIKWLLLLPVMVITDIITILCSPVAAALSMGKDALPKWLRWMQTHDNSIDALWQQPHHLRGYRWLRNKQPEDFERSALLRWYARMLWLMRNPGYGLSNYFGYETQGEQPRVLARRGKWDSDTTNWLVLRWSGAWQIRAQIFYPFAPLRYLRIYIGWKSTDGKSRLMYAGHINPFRRWRR